MFDRSNFKNTGEYINFLEGVITAQRMKIDTLEKEAATPQWYYDEDGGSYADPEEYLEAVNWGCKYDELPMPFDKPALFLLGRQDADVGYKDAWKLLDNFPRATFAVLDRAGHFVSMEQERLFGHLVTEWLDRVEEATG